MQSLYKVACCNIILAELRESTINKCFITSRTSKSSSTCVLLLYAGMSNFLFGTIFFLVFQAQLLHAVVVCKVNESWTDKENLSAPFIVTHLSVIQRIVVLSLVGFRIRFRRGVHITTHPSLKIIMMEQRLIGLPKILEFPEYPIQRNNRLALESGALKMIRKVRPGRTIFKHCEMV